MFRIFAALVIVAIGSPAFAQPPATFTVTVQPQSIFDRPPYLADGIVVNFVASMPPLPFGGIRPGWYGTNGKAEVWVYVITRKSKDAKGNIIIVDDASLCTVRSQGSCETSPISNGSLPQLFSIGVHSVGGCPRGLETFQTLMFR